ncbi:hypothetical protein BCR39DRAFT_555729 [Naematelia encephala]|uniref:Uncharacterized protein n=1 Tax=Naematelia encephala TaxID=71784 RepID=A0A1Y2BLY7_9TREE|nr:hypothetical protein BCR39DRAFT_555729 [Naematelia encephala]
MSAAIQPRYQADSLFKDSLPLAFRRDTTIRHEPASVHGDSLHRRNEIEREAENSWRLRNGGGLHAPLNDTTSAGNRQHDGADSSLTRAVNNPVAFHILASATTDDVDEAERTANEARNVEIWAKIKAGLYYVWSWHVMPYDVHPNRWNPTLFWCLAFASLVPLLPALTFHCIGRINKEKINTLLPKLEQAIQLIQSDPSSAEATEIINRHSRLLRTVRISEVGGLWTAIIQLPVLVVTYHFLGVFSVPLSYLWLYLTCLSRGERHSQPRVVIANCLNWIAGECDKCGVYIVGGIRNIHHEDSSIRNTMNIVIGLFFFSRATMIAKCWSGDQPPSPAIV